MSKQTQRYPRRVEGVKTFDIWTEMVLYSPEQEMAFSLNPTAKAIWELCDGRYTPVEMSQELGRRFDCATDDLFADVKDALDKLHELGLLKFEEAYSLRSA